MNPEPLTKEKEKTVSEVEFYNNKELLDVKIKSDGNAKEVFTAFEKSDVKSAVEWLLKEIEKEQKRDWVWIGNEKSYNEDIVFGYKGCLERMKEKIKKAFSGVMRE